MQCWFKRSKTDEWTQGIVLGYTNGGAVVKADRRGETLTVPLDRLSVHGNKPADGDDFYRDPRDPADSFTQNVPVTRPAPAGVGK